MSPTIAIAMSGGVDSLVAAHLLIQEKHSIIGIHFRTGYEKFAPVAQGGAPPELLDAAAKLGVVVHVVSIENEFRNQVIEPFVSTYLSGCTPNPCVVCNQTIKFGRVLEIARKEFAADCIATGHYVRTGLDKTGRFLLKKGADPRKDQSYFLSFLNQVQLKSAIFPLGGMLKQDVKSRAADLGLDKFTKEESQETCFIADDRYRRFLESQEGFSSRPGDILDVDGNRIGEHRGVFAYTIGQRRGINIPAKEAYYVVKIDPTRNQIIVGGKKDLLSSSAHVEGINWIVPPEGQAVRANTKIRYRHKEAASEIILDGPNTATVYFDEPQSAITPGQAAVFYDEDRVLGAGWISHGN